MKLTAEWILEAVKAIRSGLAQKLEKDGVTVYSCGKLIRIDIKASAFTENENEDDGPDTNDRTQFPACLDDVLDQLW